jgi:uncharacterized cupredoxin-like copper-binding protein
MRRGLTIFVLAALAAAGLAAGLFASGSAATTTAKKPKLVTSKVTVIASEFKFAFSKRTVPAGTVIFTVVNKGKIAHNFFIAGKVTPMLLPGKSAKLTVKLKKKGHYAYLCTVVGHAAAGMRGTFSVGVKAVTPPKVTTTATTTTTQPTTTTTPTGTVGTASTTVHVSMFEYGFTLDKSSVPSGQVTFVISNDGKEVHNFDVESIKAGAYLNPGQSETWTVALAPRTYAYECDVAFHAQQGMIGNLTVTP